MRQERLYQLINKMHHRLNRLIEKHNFDLLSEPVQQYSRRMDKIIKSYNQYINKLDH